MHYLAWASLRKDSLCGGIRDCPEANTLTCTKCHSAWIPIDILIPEACPACGAVRKYKRERCTECRLTSLEKGLQSPGGRLLNHIADLDAMLQLPGFSITANDIDAVEWNALRVLWRERDKYTEEERRRAAQPKPNG